MQWLSPEDKLLGSMTRVKKKGEASETTKTAAAVSGNPEKSPVVLLRALFLEYSPPFRRTERPANKLAKTDLCSI